MQCAAVELKPAEDRKCKERAAHRIEKGKVERVVPGSATEASKICNYTVGTLPI
jgi:hypothetical protein